LREIKSRASLAAKGVDVKDLLSFESAADPLATRQAFTLRLVRNGLWALLLVILSTAVGMAGYMGFEGMSAVDAFVNAAMILSGMGPLTPLNTEGGKIFAGVYAIVCGLMLFAIAGVILAPVYHRILHRFHVEDRENPDDGP
jgi:sterol desaturase/sphingolipid hydroxylase (fatty acid hydroxylase superfamily)